MPQIHKKTSTRTCTRGRCWILNQVNDRSSFDGMILPYAQQVVCECSNDLVQYFYAAQFIFYYDKKIVIQFNKLAYCEKPVFLTMERNI